MSNVVKKQVNKKVKSILWTIFSPFILPIAGLALLYFMILFIVEGVDQYFDDTTFNEEYYVSDNEKDLIDSVRIEMLKDKSQIIDTSNVDFTIYDSDDLIFPLRNVTSSDITSPFGWRMHPIYHTWRFHNGVDIAKPLETDILSPVNGIVTRIFWDADGGNVVTVRNDTYEFYFMHMNSIDVSVGQEVPIGTRLGGVGTTGTSTGYHLHYSVKLNSQWIDPLTLYNLNFEPINVPDQEPETKPEQTPQIPDSNAVLARLGGVYIGNYIYR